MSFRHSSVRVCCGLLVVAVSGLLPCSGQTDRKQRGRSIEFSAPRGDGDTTNLYPFPVKKDGLKELQQDVYGPLPSFTPQSSLEGVAAPPLRNSPTPSVIQSKRAKELLERRKNWMLMRPEDLMAEPTLEEILRTPGYGKDGLEKDQVTAIERYYERLNTKRPAANRADQLKEEDLFGALKKPGSNDEKAAREDSDLPGGVKESAQALRQALKKMFEPDTGSEPSTGDGTHSAFSDPFGLGQNTLSKDQELAHKKLMDEHHTLVDPSWHPPAAANSLNQPYGLSALSQPVKSPAAGLAGSPLSAPHTGLDAQMDVLSPMLGPVGLPDVTARALGQSRPSLALPSPEPAKVVAPTFTAPRRSF